jgi:hypothetical protein
MRNNPEKLKMAVGNKYGGILDQAWFDKLWLELRQREDGETAVHDAVYAVMVDGLAVARAAEEHGLSRAAVSGWCRRLYDAYVPAGWKKVTVVVPPALAREFGAKAVAARAAVKRLPAKRHERDTR